MVHPGLPWVEVEAAAVEEDGGFEFIGVTNPGFRTREVLVVTSLTNPNDISHASLANLYRRRWEAELYLRLLKTVMQMDHLRCKKPYRVRNELRMHLVAYNLIREVIAAAAVAAGVQPYQINYKGALQTLNQFPPQLLTNTPTTTWLTTLLASIAAHTIGNRPDRVEPRVRKRRPKNYPLMTNPEPPTKPEPPYKLIESPSAIQSCPLCFPGNEKSPGRTGALAGPFRTLRFSAKRGNTP